ncbi:MAG: cell division protein ZapE, partial [Bacilli bacterium]|nr:cell division protein ZapE [Bacilli bacterium]
MKPVMEELNYSRKKKLEEELNRSYEEALKNQIFYDLVSKLSLSKKELMKYTSRLEECAIEYENCKNCKSLLECHNKMNGYAYLPCVKNSHLSFEYQVCKYRKKLDEQTVYKKNMTTFEIPAELLNASMKDIDTKDKNRYPAIKWLQNFIKNYGTSKKGLYLYGNYGSGKSFFIAAMFSELAHQNIKSALVFWPEFLRDLKASFSTDFKEKYEGRLYGI